MIKKRILLVEDTADDVELMLMALQKHALTADIDVVNNGVEAIEYLTGARATPEHDQHCGLPDLVFLDLNMPLLNGFEVLKHIRASAHLQWLPVVVFTSSVEREDIKRAYTLGASSYMHKPVDFNEFSQNLKRISDYWLTLNITPQ